MVLESQRSTLDKFLMPIVKHCSNVDPNVISLLGLVFAVAAGVMLALSNEEYNYFLIIALVLVMISSYFDALDGKIAKTYNKCSLRGDYLDHVLDRYADVFIIGGIAFSAWCNLTIGVFALVGVLLTSYMGTQAQAVGAGRLYRGLLGRADRLVLTFIFVLIQFIMTVVPGDLSFINFTISDIAIHMSWLDIVLIWFAVAGNYTALQRAIIIWKDLSKKG